MLMTMTRKIAIVRGFILAAGGLVSAQRGTTSPAASAWFGQPLPGPASDGVTPAFDTLHTDIGPAPAAFAPGPKDPQLQGERIKADLKTIVGFSLKSKSKGDFLWGRISGTPEYYETAQWGVEQLKKAGLKEAHIEDFSATRTIAVAGEVRLIGSADFGVGSNDVVLKSTMVGGRNAVNGTVTAPLIYVGHASDADLIGRDIKGKIAVVHSTPNPGVFSTNENGRLAPLIRLGAAGVIEILEQPGNMQSFDGDRHGCSPNLCFTVGGEDGFFLESVLGKAGAAGKTITATLMAKSQERADLKTANGVATIPGKTDRTLL